MRLLIRFGVLGVLFLGVVFALPLEFGRYDLFFEDLARVCFLNGFT